MKDKQNLNKGRNKKSPTRQSRYGNGALRGIKSGILRSQKPSFAKATEGSLSPSSQRQASGYSAKENNVIDQARHRMIVCCTNAALRG